MPQNISVHLSGNDKLDLELIQIEISQTLVYILANTIALISAALARQIIIQRASGIQPSDSKSSQLSALASGLGLLSNITLGEVAFVRLHETENNIQSGASTFSITPNVNITTGYLYSIIGSFLRTLGALQRVNEEAQITIL